MKELNNVPGLEHDKVVKIKKFTYGDKNKLSSKCVSINFQTQKPEFNLASYRTYVLVFGIVEAPFGLSVEDIDNLLPETGEYLFTEILNYNGMGDDKNALIKK